MHFIHIYVHCFRHVSHLPIFAQILEQINLFLTTELEITTYIANPFSGQSHYISTEHPSQLRKFSITIPQTHENQTHIHPQYNNEDVTHLDV